MTRTLPVIMLTSSVQDEDVVDSCDGGANSYVQKPVDPEHFLTVAHHLGVYWLTMHHQSPPMLTAGADGSPLADL